MKSFIWIISLLCFTLTSSLSAQTIRWVPSNSLQSAACPPQVRLEHALCYSMEYTPATSGVLTSYTTGFFLSCTAAEQPVFLNKSCVMTGNVRLLNACSTHEVSLLNSSGNAGVPGENDVVANVPVILHQVCFNLQPGETLEITEDHSTDLTTSILTPQGLAVAEYPVFEAQSLKRPKIAKPFIEPANHHSTLNPVNIGLGSDENNELVIATSPNPAGNFTIASFSGYHGNSIIRCMDLHGKTMVEKEVADGDRQLKLDTSAWPSGTYYIMLQTEEQTSSSSFVVSH